MADPNAPSFPMAAPTDVEQQVRQRYADGAAQCETALCCPTQIHDPALLANLPKEIIEKDYGCGDPSQWVTPGDTVVDLGSGSGKACYIMAQKVGQAGKVIGVDFNDAMLNLARKYQDEMAQKLGYANVTFHKGKIQDLALDLGSAQSWLAQHPVDSVEAMADYEAYCDEQRQQKPMIEADSVDVVVSNCVLNLVKPADKTQLFNEIFRVLKNGGQAVISDIVSDEDPTDEMAADPQLWSGCISGAFREDRFLHMFEQAGFHGIEILQRSDQPWQVVDGIEFRAVTIRAYKGKQGPCLEGNQAVVYKGPWKQVRDDDGHTYFRGQRMAVCDKTYRLMTDPAGPYAGQVIGIEPGKPVDLASAKQFECTGATIRDPKQTKGAGQSVSLTNLGDACCEPGGSCC